jgi:hypothetical protein
MNREDIIRMYAKANGWSPAAFTDTLEELERFAALVTKHTLANIDPRSFMSWQEGYEAGKQTEREACAKLCEDLDAWNMDDPASTAAKAIRARGQE